MTPALRLLLATFGLLYLLKAVSLLTQRGRSSFVGNTAFLLAWPGVVPHHFQCRGAERLIDAPRFLSAGARFVFGAVAMGMLAVFAPYVPDVLLGLAGIAALLLTVHLGLGDLLPWLLGWAGFNVPLLFDRPWAAKSLAEFWGRR